MLLFRRALAVLIVAALIGAAAWVIAPPRTVDWDRLEPGVRIYLPPGDGPFPVAILLHGCGGQRPFLDKYVDAALEAGAAAVTVDSFGPRGIGRARASATVCTGMRLRGDSRTSDVTLTLENLADDPELGPRLDMSRVALAGWSHGAWTVAELLTEAPAERGVRSAFLVYPYCRFPARWPGRAAPKDVTILAVVPDLDAVGDAPACRAALERTGADIVRIEGATHAFEEDYAIGFPFRHHAEAFAENQTRFRDFLADTLGADTAGAPLAPGEAGS